jgi:hypothetical protein
VTSDDISADFIIRHLAGSSRGTVAIVDCLQILDQQRAKPVLSEQMLAPRDLARTNRVILGFISTSSISPDAFACGDAAKASRQAGIGPAARFGQRTFGTP